MEKTMTHSCDWKKPTEQGERGSKRDWPDPWGQTGRGSLRGMGPYVCLSISVLIPCMCEAEKDGKKTTTFRVRKPDLKSWCVQDFTEPQLCPL